MAATPSDSSASPSSTKQACLPGSLSLVLPAHNEEDNIKLVVDHVLEVLPRFTNSFEIIVVNDGSRDKTAAIIDELGRCHPEVKPRHHAVNRGYGGALATGFKASTCDYVMFMDADRQFDIVDLGLLAPFVGKFDIVAGFRKERNDPFIRRANAEVFNLVVRALFGVHLHDIDCAFKIFKGGQIRAMTLTEPGALVNTEMQAKLRRQHATIQQVAVNHYPRVAGTATGGNLRVILRAMKGTALLWWDMRSYQPPTKLDASS